MVTTALSPIEPFLIFPYARGLACFACDCEGVIDLLERNLPVSRNRLVRKKPTGLRECKESRRSLVPSVKVKSVKGGFTFKLLIRWN